MNYDFSQLKVFNKSRKVTANIFGYHMVWREPNSTPKDGTIVGEVQNLSGNFEFAIPIVIDEQTLAITHQPKLFFIYDDSDYCKGSWICLSRKFYSDLIENNNLISLIWHEVGHFHTLQYFKFKTNDEIRMERKKCVLDENDILAEEKAADLFAVMYCHSEPWIEAINYNIAERRKMMIDSNRTGAVRELTMRKKYIKSLKDNDYEIETALYELLNSSK